MENSMDIVDASIKMEAVCKENGKMVNECNFYIFHILNRYKIISFSTASISLNICIVSLMITILKFIIFQN